MPVFCAATFSFLFAFGILPVFHCTATEVDCPTCLGSPPTDFPSWPQVFTTKMRALGASLSYSVLFGNQIINAKTFPATVRLILPP